MRQIVEAGNPCRHRKCPRLALDRNFGYCEEHGESFRARIRASYVRQIRDLNEYAVETRSAEAKDYANYLAEALEDFDRDLRPTTDPTSDPRWRAWTKDEHEAFQRWRDSKASDSEGKVEDDDALAF